MGGQQLETAGDERLGRRRRGGARQLGLQLAADEAAGPAGPEQVTERGKALAVTVEVRRYRKHANFGGYRVGR